MTITSKKSLNVTSGKWANTCGGTVDFEAGGLLKGVSGAQNNALSKHYLNPNAESFSTFENSKLKSLRDAYTVIKYTNTSKSDDQIHNALVKHFNEFDAA